MSQSFVGEIRMFGGNFAPANWAMCNGQLLPVNEYEALFTLIGTTYGGDGVSTFALPDLRGRMPIGQGTGPGQPARILGETGGVESVTLTIGQMAAHSHALMATRSDGNVNNAQSNVTSASPSITLYYEDAPTPGAKLNFGAIKANGGGGPHENRQPFLAVSFIISLFGTFPPPG